MFFIDKSTLFLFGYLLELPHQGHSNKYTKCMIYKRTVKQEDYSGPVLLPWDTNANYMYMGMAAILTFKS